jgi:hypothetical protein
VPVSNSASLPFARGYLALIGQGLLSMSKLVGNQHRNGVSSGLFRGGPTTHHKPVTTSLSSLSRCLRTRARDR